ncbi:MAG: anthranilate synthase component I family protein [Flavobacteriales bacterium]|nr:anthranilate synthase component I family protein [Flavobacteriales bacterium]
MSDRIVVPLGRRGLPVFSRLGQEELFLFRRTADREHAILGVGSLRSFRAEGPAGAFDRWSEAFRERDDVSMGHLGYELRLDSEPRSGAPPVARTSWPALFWFVPRIIVEWERGEAFLKVLREDEQAGMELAERLFGPWDPGRMRAFPELRLLVDEQRYLERAERALSAIQRGDVYELNYCIERQAACLSIQAPHWADRCLRLSDAPFAGVYKLGDQMAVCLSPERFLEFTQDGVLAEPMKGTRPRSEDPGTDQDMIDELRKDPKERAENIMATDVMRNDLSRFARAGTVEVRSLCEVRSMSSVHQMVSVVHARIGDTDRTQVVRACFPMASMTGAPKVRAMQLIDELEGGLRGLFSGSLGYLMPDGSGDLNVVIRTLLFDGTKDLVSLMTGSALTALCDPVQEWEECDLKARSVIDLLRDEPATEA